MGQIHRLKKRKLGDHLPLFHDLRDPRADDGRCVELVDTAAVERDVAARDFAEMNVEQLRRRPAALSSWPRCSR